MENSKIYAAAIEKWGNRSQLEMLQEESTELALATRKFIRNNDEESMIEVAKEIADVQIMIEQFLFMYPEMQLKINDEKLYKLFRLSDRVQKNQFNGDK